MTQMLVVMVTCPASKEAEDIARALLEERLVACVNITGGVQSLFRWKGSIQQESESLLLMKTRAQLFERLSERIRQLHPYEVPEIVAIPIVMGNPDYLDWIVEATSDREGD